MRREGESFLLSLFYFGSFGALREHMLAGREKEFSFFKARIYERKGHHEWEEFAKEEKGMAHGRKKGLNKLRNFIVIWKV